MSRHTIMINPVIAVACMHQAIERRWRGNGSNTGTPAATHSRVSLLTTTRFSSAAMAATSTTGWLNWLKV